MIGMINIDSKELYGVSGSFGIETVIENFIIEHYYLNRDKSLIILSNIIYFGDDEKSAKYKIETIHSIADWIIKIYCIEIIL